ncbi:unnamed protein product [Adineta ricciae]|uniref:Uncharacterized protein n=1 Tax=Adineta ricciae TaxID=249248 RepID=A0A814RA62_ADIRI|nr:unnamed protein product [Adineta ricciae]CAF1440742.1 unnamed protein product [Adineta ricciae]
MKYQRVLYTNKFSAELKSKLRIVSYEKRRSLKGNVYYVSFASDADITYAGRICKRLRNVTMKPFQSRSADEIQYQCRSKRCDEKKTHVSAATIITSTPGTNCHTVICSPKQINNQVVELPPDVSNIKLYNVQSCIDAMKTAQRVANDVYQLFKNGMDYDVVLDRLLQAHATASYLKAATSIKIKDVLSAGVTLSWPNVADDINEFRLAVSHERSFIMKMASAQHILSKINNESSITLSSKLVYQLTKLSH